MPKKVKILAASDLHGDSKQVKKLAERAEKENVDLVILCGDLTGWVETKDIIKPFQDKKKKILLIPGNHEDAQTGHALAKEYNATNIDGYAFIHEGIGIFGAGGSTDLPHFPGFITETQLKKKLTKAHKELKGIEKKIMITHMHPADSLSEFSGFPGSKAITQAFKEFKPNVVLHGHIHEGAGLEQTIGKTKIINVGKKGVIIEI